MNANNSIGRSSFKKFATFWGVNKGLSIKIHILSLAKSMWEMSEVILIIRIGPRVTESNIDFLRVEKFNHHAEVYFIIRSYFEFHWRMVSIPLASFNPDNRPV